MGIGDAVRAGRGEINRGLRGDTPVAPTPRRYWGRSD